jgi:hypothetical protein
VSATAISFTAFAPEALGTQLPTGSNVPLQANAQIGQGQLATFDASGNAALNDGTVAALIAAGVGADKLSDTNTTAALAKARMHEGMGVIPFSTAASDGFAAADIGGVPAFIADENTIGKLSNVSGNDRSFAGVCFGLVDTDNTGTLARFWGGRDGQLVARALHSLINDATGLYSYAQDASASTDLGSASGGPPGTALTTIGFVLARPKRRSLITSVEIIPSSALSASGATNYRYIQLWKVDGTGGVALGSSPLVATFTTSTQALVAGQPTAFTLGAAAALLLRETDFLAGISVHASAGATVPQSFIRANAKVI